MKNLPLFMLLIALVSCSSEGRRSTEALAVYPIDYRVDAPNFWDEYFEYDHHVTLETTDSALFRVASKVVVDDAYIYILCLFEKKVLVFDHRGRNVHCIDRRGNGPEEYLDASDLIVNADRTIELLDATQQRIMVYTLDGAFVRSLPCLRARSFVKVGEDTYILNRVNARAARDTLAYNFVVWQAGQVRAKDVPYVPGMAGRSFTYGEGNSFLYPDFCGLCVPYNDTLYTYDRHRLTLERTCCFDFQVERPDGSYSQEETREYLKKQEEVPSSLYGICRVGDWMYGRFGYGDAVKQVMIHTVTGQVRVSRLGGFCKDGLGGMPFPYTDLRGDSCRYVACMLDANVVKGRPHPEDYPVLQRISREMEDAEANPAIVFYRLRADAPAGGE